MSTAFLYCGWDEIANTELLIYDDATEKKQANTVKPPWSRTSSLKRPALLSEHLAKIPIASSVSQIAISETSRKRPPPC